MLCKKKPPTIVAGLVGIVAAIVLVVYNQSEPPRLRSETTEERVRREVREFDPIINSAYSQWSLEVTFNALKALRRSTFEGTRRGFLLKRFALQILLAEIAANEQAGRAITQKDIYRSLLQNPPKFGGTPTVDSFEMAS